MAIRERSLIRFTSVPVQVRQYLPLRIPNSLLILNAPDSVRVLHLPIATKEMRRETSVLLSLHQPGCEMRVQPAVVVGGSRTAEYAEGEGEEQDPTDQDE